MTDFMADRQLCECDCAETDSVKLQCQGQEQSDAFMETGWDGSKHDVDGDKGEKVWRDAGDRDDKSSECGWGGDKIPSSHAAVWFAVMWAYVYQAYYAIFLVLCSDTRHVTVMSSFVIG